MPEVKKEIESLIKVIRRLEITLNPHWPISSSEDQLVNPYDLFAVNPKYILCLGQHPQFHYTVQDKGQTARRLVFKPFIGNCNRANSLYSHFFCILGVQTKFTLQLKSFVQAIPLLTHTKLYTPPSLGQWGKKSYPVQRLIPFSSQPGGGGGGGLAFRPIIN